MRLVRRESRSLRGERKLRDLFQPISHTSFVFPLKISLSCHRVPFAYPGEV
jgi:hypothetical protein